MDRPSLDPGAAPALALDRLDAPVRALFERVLDATAGEDPDLVAIGAALVELAADRDYLAPLVAALGDRAGPLRIHAPERGPRLMLVHRPEGRMSAVHDHGTWVAISPISGLETHRRYRVRGSGASARPEAVETRRLSPADAVTLLPPDDLHDHGHLAGHGLPAHVLILTGDDQLRYPRTEWDLATGRRRVLSPGDRGRWNAVDPWPGD